MSVIQEDSEKELVHRKAEAAREGAVDEVGSRLRDLAANMLRVIRGAGKPWEIGGQAQAVIESMIEYREVVGHFPSSEEVASALDIERDPEWMARASAETRHFDDAQQTVIHGALQIAASRLLGQNTQEAAGRHELFGGVAELEEIREQNRKAAHVGPKTNRGRVNGAARKGSRGDR